MTRRRAQILFGVAAALCVLHLLSFYPGAVSSDPVTQLRQARSFGFTDWHPPIMGVLWRLVDVIIPGQFGMLALDSAAYWAGCAIVAWLLPGLALPLGFLGFAFVFPPGLALMGKVWKDVSLTSALWLAFALVLLEERTGRRHRWPLWALLFYATGVRHNAVPAIFPFVLWALRGVRLLSASQRVIRATGLTLALFAGNAILSNILCSGQATMPIQQIYKFDIQAISLRLGQNLMPQFMELGENPHSLSLEALRTYWRPDSVTPIDEAERATKPEQVAMLRSSWLATVAAHPWEYLSHRSTYFLDYLLAWAVPAQELSFDGISGNDLGLKFDPIALFHQPPLELVASLREGPLFRPWIYFFALAAALALAWRRIGRAGIVLASSGFLYTAAYFVIGQAAYFRFCWWTVLAAAFLPFVVLTGAPTAKAKKKTPEPRARPAPSSRGRRKAR